MSSLQQRILSSVVLAPLALAALYFGDLSFSIFMGIAGLVMAYEWCTVSFQKNRFRYFVLMGLWVVVAAFLAHEALLLEAIGVSLFSALCLTILARVNRKAAEWPWVGLGPIYVGIPMICLIALRAHPGDGFPLAASLFFIIWATDIGAYFSGKTIGGPKIMVSISPNKTWAGLIGGMTSAAVVAVLCLQMLDTVPFNAVEMALAGAAMAVLAQIGDFSESAWKRHFGVKDASNLIPGHGGVLDRLDGVLFVAPALYGLVVLANGN
nr:phosphatidate cytidylyltransferase [Sneathiella chinensis]